MTWAELTHREDLERDILEFERMLGGEIDGYSLEKRLIRKDGSSVDTIMSVRVVRLPDGSPDYCLAQIQDISNCARLISGFLTSSSSCRMPPLSSMTENG